MVERTYAPRTESLSRIRKDPSSRLSIRCFSVSIRPMCLWYHILLDDIFSHDMHKEFRQIESRSLNQDEKEREGEYPPNINCFFGTMSTVERSTQQRRRQEHSIRKVAGSFKGNCQIRVYLSRPASTGRNVYMTK